MNEKPVCNKLDDVSRAFVYIEKIVKSYLSYNIIITDRRRTRRRRSKEKQRKDVREERKSGRTFKIKTLQLVVNGLKIQKKVVFQNCFFLNRRHSEGQRE